MKNVKALFPQQRISGGKSNWAEVSSSTEHLLGFVLKAVRIWPQKSVNFVNI